MAMTDEQGVTLLSRLSGGERLNSVLRDMDVSRDDFAAWRRDNRVAFRGARKAGRPSKVKLTKEGRLEKLQQRRTRLAIRLARVDARIAVVEAD